MLAATAEWPGVQRTRFGHLGRLADRWTRQLMVNRLYFFFEPSVGLYSHSRSSILRDKASRNHLASPAAAVLPT
jgi:hypothetical protein